MTRRVWVNNAWVDLGGNGGDTGTIPSELSNGEVWLDASDAATLTLSGLDVTAWADKFHGRNFVGASGSYPTLQTAGLNGLNTLDFSSDWITFDAGSDTINMAAWTFICVAKDNALGGYRRLASARSSDSTNDYQTPNVVFAYSNAVNGLIAVSNSYATPSINNTVWEIVQSSASSSGVTISRFGTTMSSGYNGAAGVMRYLRIGAGCRDGGHPPGSGGTDERWAGSVAELVIYNRVLNSTEIAGISTYLTNKWGL